MSFFWEVQAPEKRRTVIDIKNGMWLGFMEKVFAKIEKIGYRRQASGYGLIIFLIKLICV